MRLGPNDMLPQSIAVPQTAVILLFLTMLFARPHILSPAATSSHPQFPHPPSAIALKLPWAYCQGDSAALHAARLFFILRISMLVNLLATV